jgi:hypothetical protein
VRIRIILLVILVAGMAGSCGTGQAPEPIPQIISLTATFPILTSTPTSSVTVTQTASSTTLPTSTCTSTPDYNNSILGSLGANGQECLPDKTKQGIGVLVYDLDLDTELVSINPDVPFQFASAFKGPVLVYFLERCRKYWDPSVTEWDAYFHDLDSAGNISWYTSEEYMNNLVAFITREENWGGIQEFSANNRVSSGGVLGPADQRYLILEQVYNMVTQSDNQAAGLVFNFIFENCPGDPPSALVDKNCGGPNAITEFNQWFEEFAQIEYQPGELHRGLNNFDLVTVVDGSGNLMDIRMPTFGQADICAVQGAFKDCSDSFAPGKAWTARDLFKFYYSLFHEQDETMRNTAMNILRIDNVGNSRGYLKDMARRMNADALSKNGFSDGAIADAGILEYKGKSYAISTLGYNAAGSMIILFGEYNPSGEPASAQKGLLQEMFEGKYIP